MTKMLKAAKFLYSRPFYNFVFSFVEYSYMIGRSRLFDLRLLFDPPPIIQFQFAGKTSKCEHIFSNRLLNIKKQESSKTFLVYRKPINRNMPPKRKAQVKEEVAAKVEEKDADEVPAIKSRRVKKEVAAVQEVKEKPVTERRAKKKAVENGDEKASEENDSKPPAKLAKETKKTKAAGDAKDVKEVKTRKQKVTEEIKEEAPIQKNGSGDGPSKKPTKARAAKAKKEEEPEAKTAKAKTKKDKAPAKKATTRKEKKTKDDKEPNDEGGLMNQTHSSWDEIDFGCEKLNSKGEKFDFKITSWNVDGIRAWLKKDGMKILEYAKPDILCLQETKISEDSLPAELTDVEGYETFWCASEKNGYAGVALFSKVKPISHQYGIGNEEHDDEGRCITAEFDKFYVISVYVPNAGRKLVTLDKRLDWNDQFKNYVNALNKKKPVIICGDMNVAHNEIDLANPKTNKKNAGFTQEERDGLTDFLGEGYVDTYRHFHPDEKDVYTFWTYMSNARIKNLGWRLDYFIVSEELLDSVCDNVVHNKVYGSDHCPLTLFIKAN